MKLRILRKLPTEEGQFWEEFEYSGPADYSVAAMLEDLNYRDDIINSKGEQVPRISWACSCLQSKCGACAMVINGTPALACETFLRDLGSSVTLQPLSKFPVISDLVVDRSGIQENLLNTSSFIKEYKESPQGEHGHQYTAAKCLKCGLCLEVCPNYKGGEHFYGALFANDCYLIATRSGVFDDSISEEYKKHFGSGCSKSFSCMDVCPMNIPTLSSMAKMNRRRS